MRPLRYPTFEMDKIEAPTSAEHAGDNVQRLSRTSRRSFFAQGVGVAAGTAAVLGASTSAQAASNPLPSLYPRSTAMYFQELQFDEASHVNINKTAILSLGGTVRPDPTFTGITNLTATQLLNLSVLIANTGVGALSFAGQYISNPAVYSVASSILLVEAYHAGFLNAEANIALVPNNLVYDVPLSIAEVTARLNPYIVSLNDNGQFPASFSTTEKSTTNDIAILNFAIIIDLLEATLYFNNVPRLFR